MTLIKRIKDRRGESYIDTAVTVFAIATLLALTVNFFALFILKQDVDTVAAELVEVACAGGGTGTEFSERMQDLKDGFGFTFTVTTEGSEYIQGSSSKVQLGNTIVVTVTASMNIKGFGKLKVPVTVTSKQSGLSRVYWK